ncbi:hypothetical protein Y695_04495 [Hydrogenophaga sp. T4]|nr:hypothetical protein Y695_04495 [Hydrogenophaga sp. T4]
MVALTASAIHSALRQRGSMVWAALAVSVEQLEWQEVQAMKGAFVGRGRGGVS